MDAYIGEVRWFTFDVIPEPWVPCDGKLLPIMEHQALFSLLGTTFGGDGRVNFALPDLRGRAPIHVGSGHTLGERGGEQAHTLSIAELPTHVHVLNANTSGTGGTANPTNNFLGGANNAYHAPSNLTAMNPGTILNTGGSQAHLNMQPFLTLNFCIALQGIFPSPN